MDIDDNGKSTVPCVVCNTSVDRDDVCTTSYSDYVCNECVRICERCNDVGTENDSFNMVDGDEMWCEVCVDRRAYWCDSCNEYNSLGTCYINDRGESWCEGCTNNAYFCEECDTYTADGCDSCADNTDENGNRIIHDYSYRPDAIFHSTDKNERLYFGIEIEVEDSRYLSESSAYAHRLEGMELAYLKHDGSLSCGYEIVTHPMSHDYYKNEASDLWDTLEHLRTHYRVKSWDTTTCGLHIHVSRTGFEGGSHMHRFLNLIYSNPDLYQTLAGREQSRWATFDDIVSEQVLRDEHGNRMTNEEGFTLYTSKRSVTSKLIGNGNGTERYSAVNTRNRETLEIRIFRGTVNSQTVKAHLDLAHASVEYTRRMTVKDIREGALDVAKFIDYITAHADLYPELHERVTRLVLPTLVRLNGQNESN
jgi:hypothetical protein